MDMLDPTLDHTGDPDGKGDSPGPESHVQLHGDSVEGIVSNHYADESLVAGQSIALDPTTNIHYQLRPEPGSQGQVTYRVVQVTQPLEGGGDATQVIASPFSNGNSPTDDSQPETRFTYFPNTTTADVTQAAADVATIPVGQVSAAGGQFYVMMSPPDVLQGPSRSIAPRTHSYTPKMEGARTTRDERRRATHNEVERRRRDKINNWIVQLSKLVPDCAAELKQGGIRNSEVFTSNQTRK
ncbi:upstream stimulatory factor-like isoform X2 [Tubulanus polymorphus]|uniref:upstream stimulatory factor-like isoform X2 n=1 Tax=Tubulanus polymorphus TaxID=672921 RepID=UPI003DA33AE6